MIVTTTLVTRLINIAKKVSKNMLHLPWWKLIGTWLEIKAWALAYSHILYVTRYTAIQFVLK